MTAPLVSIVIPCYNAEKYVGEAIQSALDQTYPNFEVIVIDDGSTDGSLERIRSFGEAIRWETGPNRGGAAARNRGVGLARGRLVQFLDADDLLYPQKLARQVPLAVANSGNLVLCDWETGPIDRPDQRQVRSNTYAGDDPVIRALSERIHTPAPLHSKELLESIGGFREELPCGQDRDLYLRLACAGASFSHLSDVLYIVRKRPGSVSSNTIRVLDGNGRIHGNAYAELKRAGKLTERRAAAFAGRMACDARQYLQCGMKAKAREYFRAARRMHPGGGIREAYSPLGRVLCGVLGPALTDRIAVSTRSVRARIRRLRLPS